uniref:Uncharacterized protein n=1 Tax=Sorangium cellulosum So0157-2 TaxID=1254432 RepID=A0A0G2YCT9_SORCE|nr:hypothetical protein [Sorangium cellulosum So0157-2]
MTPRPSPFREAPRPLRNALEIVLVAGAVLAIAAAACTTDAEAYIAAERERAGLSCDASGHSDGARRTLGKWFFLRAIGAEPAGAGPCHFPLREPTEPGPGGTLLVLVTAAAPVAAAAAVTLGRRARIRGALLGRPALAFVAAVALVAVFVAVALRHRIHATRESLERDFSGYRALCKEYRETAVGDANVLEDTRKALCKSDAVLSLCNAKQDWSEIDNAYETYCSDQPGRTTSACDDYRIHVSNRVKTVQRIPVDSCRDRAEQQPLTGLVALVKRIQPSATKPRPAPEPSAAARHRRRGAVLRARRTGRRALGGRPVG